MNVLLLVLTSAASFASAEIQVTDLYEVGQGSVALTTSLRENDSDRGNLEIQNQYLYSPYGVQKNLNHPMLSFPLPHAGERALFNQTRKPLNITHNQFGYTGESADSSTGLMMLGGFRNYAPGIGRFIQPDSYNSFSKQHIKNADAYVEGNPLFFADPSGHFVIVALLFLLQLTTITVSAPEDGAEIALYNTRNETRLLANTTRIFPNIEESRLLSRGLIQNAKVRLNQEQCRIVNSQLKELVSTKTFSQSAINIRKQGSTDRWLFDQMTEERKKMFQNPDKITRLETARLQLVRYFPMKLDNTMDESLLNKKLAQSTLATHIEPAFNEYNAGNCGELSYVLGARLKRQGIRSAVVSINKGNHAFLAILAKQGDSFVIKGAADPFLGRFFDISDLPDFYGKDSAQIFLPKDYIYQQNGKITFSHDNLGGLGQLRRGETTIPENLLI